MSGALTSVAVMGGLVVLAGWFCGLCGEVVVVGACVEPGGRVGDVLVVSGERGFWCGDLFLGGFDDVLWVDGFGVPVPCFDGLLFVDFFGVDGPPFVECFAVR